MSLNLVQPGPPAPCPVITGEYTFQDYETFIFGLTKGDVFQFDEKTINFETVAAQLIRYAYQAGIDFGFVYLEPGTILYGIYGANTVLVTQNE